MLGVRPGTTLVSVAMAVLDTESAGTGPGVVAIGVFDGVHLGHRGTLGRARSIADGLGLPLTVMTFEPHPMAVLRPQAAPRMLSSLSFRLELLEQVGVDRAYVIPFSKEFASLSAEDFVAEYLVRRLAARAVVVGENFRFGHKAAGDVQLLRTLGEAAGFECHPMSLVADESGLVWSSTEIRSLIAAGEVEAAAQGLLRPHRIEGVVEQGDQRGRLLGYPTANLGVAQRLAIPADGVYAGWLLTEGGRLPSAISVGVNKTFDGQDSRVEAFALDQPEWLDLYGQPAAVEFTHRLRGMVRFEDAEELTSAIATDVMTTRSLLGL